MPDISETNRPEDIDIRVNVVVEDSKIVVTFSHDVQWLKLTVDDAKELVRRMNVRIAELSP